MSRQSDVEVQHWVRAAQIQQLTGRPEFNLFEVALEYSVPPDTEFPRVVPHWDMFLRVVSRNVGETRVLVRVHHEVRPGRWELRNEYENPRHRLALPADRTAIHDRPIRLANVSLGGTGLHAISIFYRPVDDSDDTDDYLWDRDETPWDPDEAEWSFGAVEYFRVRRPI